MGTRGLNKELKRAMSPRTPVEIQEVTKVQRPENREFSLGSLDFTQTLINGVINYVLILMCIYLYRLAPRGNRKEKKGRPCMAPQIGQQKAFIYWDTPGKFKKKHYMYMFAGFVLASIEQKVPGESGRWWGD